MLKRLIIVVILLVAIFGGIFAVKYVQFQKMSAQLAQPQPPATVASTEVQTEHWQPNLRAVGSLVAINGIEVTTEVAGIVSEIDFVSGQRVQKGDVLLKLDDTVDRATLAGLKANKRLAQVQLRRVQNLLSRKVVSKSDFDEAKAKYDAADAAVSEQEAVIAKKTIRASFAGLIGIRQVDLGQYLAPGTQIVSLQALKPIFVDYALPEREFRKIATGQAVKVAVDAYPNEAFTGKVTAVEPGVDRGNRMVQVRATMTNEDARLRPGMFAEVTSLLPGQQQVLTVPRTAISYNTYGDFVYLIANGPGGKLVAKRHQVATGRAREGRVEIKTGLKAGQRVVRAGLVKLRDGQPVKIDNSVALHDAEVAAE